jgi:hypothetical protein
LLDATGKIAAVTRSDYDGFFLFERVAYGQYKLRLTAESAEAAGVETAIGKSAEIAPNRTVVRLGAIRVRKLDRIALADPAEAMQSRIRVNQKSRQTTLVNGRIPAPGRK